MRGMLAVLSAVGFLAAAASVDAQNLAMGRHEISLSGSLEMDTPTGTDWDLNGSYGYFVRDNWEAGVSLGIADNDYVSSVRLGGFTEYNFATMTQWVPYVGGALLWGQTNPDIGDRQDAAVLNPYFGLKYFITDDVSVFGQVDFEFASEDLYVDEDGDAEDTNWLFDLGIRFYL